MNNKKIVTIILTVIFIGAAGILYSLGASKDTNSNVILKENDDERVLNSSQDQIQDKKNSVEKITELSHAKEGTKESQAHTDYTGEEDLENFIYVHICGEVKNPRVYKVKKDARLTHVIEQAGGLTNQAASDYINQARFVIDGEKIYIPSTKEVKEMNLIEKENDITMKEQETASQSSSSKRMININTASLEELMTLTGIGQAKANSIIAYRESNGLFKSIDEVKNIEGIKDGVFKKIRDLITIN